MLAVSKKKLDTNDKYLQKLEDIKIRVPKGYRDIIKEFAKGQGKNVNQLVIELINERMEQVGYKDRIPNGVREATEKSTQESEWFTQKTANGKERLVRYCPAAFCLYYDRGAAGGKSAFVFG